MKARSVIVISGVCALIGCGGAGTTGAGGGSSTTSKSATSSTGAMSTGAMSTGSMSTTGTTTSSQTGSGSTTSGGFGGGLPGGPSSTRLAVRAKGFQGSPLGYIEYLPPGYGDGQKYPIILFHHGIGEGGDGSEAQVANIFNTGLPALLKHDKWPEDRPFIVLGSQHDAPPGQSCHTTKEIEDFTAYAVAHYDVDTTRMYITGLSCGAIGSWGYLGQHTNDTFAAAVLISGDGHGAFNQAGCNLGKIPIWAFHGDMDPTVNDSGSIDPINSLNACTNPAPVDAELTLYPGVGHDAWDMTYDLTAGHDIYAWMLSHTH